MMKTKECARKCCTVTCECCIAGPKCILERLAYIIVVVAAIILFIFLVWYFWRDLVYTFTNYRYQELKCKLGTHLLGNKCVADGTPLEDPVVAEGSSAP